MSVGKLKKVPLREIWEHEAKDFSEWLAKNIDVLNEKIDLELSVVETNKTVGSFFIDILAEDEQGEPVIIENQLEKTDHDHLGKIITYISSIGGKAGIWVTGRPRPEHEKAIQWLNSISPPNITFYLIKLEAVRIGDSLPAALFSVIARPDTVEKKIGEKKQQLAKRHVIRKQFWTLLLKKLNKKTDYFSNISPKTGGWIGAGAGRAGMGYKFAISKKEGWVNLYIDRGKGYGKLNKRRFDKLHEHKNEIEKVFGDSLEWRRMDNNRASRIIKRYTKMGGLYSEDKWDKLTEAMSDGMVNFIEAFSPFISEIK